MNLSLKQKALLITFGLLVSMIVGSGIVILITEYVSFQIIGNVLGFVFFSWMVWLLYSITLNRLEYEEKLKKMKE